MTIAAGEFKTHCLRLMDDVKNRHCSFVITKRGKPVAKLVPVDEEAPPPVFGFLKGRARIDGDIIKPTGETWDAET